MAMASRLDPSRSGRPSSASPPMLAVRGAVPAFPRPELGPLFHVPWRWRPLEAPGPRDGRGSPAEVGQVRVPRARRVAIPMLHFQAGQGHAARAAEGTA